MDKRLAALLAILLVAGAALLHQERAPSATGVRVVVLPGEQLHGLTAPLIVIQGHVDPRDIQVTARLVLHAEPQPWYTGVPPQDYASSIFTLPVYHAPMLCGDDCLVAVAPPGPAGLVTYNSSSLGVTNGVVKLNSTLYVNVTLNGELVASITINFTYPAEPPDPIPVWNTSRLVVVTEPGESVELCGFAIGPPWPKLNLTVSTNLGSTWSPLATNPSYPQPLLDAAKTVNATVAAMVEDMLVKRLEADSYTEPPYTGPGLALLCYHLDPAQLGLTAGASIALSLEAMGAKSPSLALYVDKGGFPRIAVIDPSLDYILAALPGDPAEYRSLLEEYGVAGLAYHGLYERAWGVIASLASTWSGLRLPDWGVLGANGGLEVFEDVEGFAGSRAPYDLVVYSSPLWPEPRQARLAETLLTEGVERGDYSLIVLGPVAPRLYAWRGSTGVTVRDLSGYRGGLAVITGIPVPAALASLTERLLDASDPGVVAMLYTPPWTPGIEALIATRWASLLGYQPGEQLSVTTPLPASLRSQGYSYLTSPEWVYQLGSARIPRLAALVSAPEYRAAASTLADELLPGYPGAGYEASTALATLPSLLGNLSTASWTGPGFTLEAPLLGRVEASLPPLAHRLSTIEPLAKPLFEAPSGTAVIAYRDLCEAGRRVVYSSIPLQLSDAASLLRALASLALEEPACTETAGVYHDASVEPSSLAGNEVLVASRVLLVTGEANTTICGHADLLVVAPLDYNDTVTLYVNGTRVEPHAEKGGVKAYRLRGRCWRLRVTATGEYEPERVLLLLYARPTTTTTTVTETKTVTTTTTVYRNVTIPAGTVTKTIYVTETATTTKTIVSTVTTTLEKTVTFIKNTTVTVTETRATTTTVTKTLVSTVTQPPSTVTVTSVKRVVERRTVTIPSPVTVTPPASQTQSLVLLAAGLAAGAALGFLAPRLASRLASRSS